MTASPSRKSPSEHDVRDGTVYGWLESKARGAPSMLQYMKFERENVELLRLVGRVTLTLSETQEKG